MSIRTAVATGALIVVLGTALAQSPAPAPLDARASDPIAMGWMAGSPPPAARSDPLCGRQPVRFPQTRWAFSHIRELVPTVKMSRGAGRWRRFPAPNADSTPLPLPHRQHHADDLEQRSIANYTDGILICTAATSSTSAMRRVGARSVSTSRSRSPNRSSPRWRRCSLPRARSTSTRRSRTTCPSSRPAASATPPCASCST